MPSLSQINQKEGREKKGGDAGQGKAEQMGNSCAGSLPQVLVSWILCFQCFDV